MTIRRVQMSLLWVLVIVALLMVGCTAGDARFTPETPAGFWVGLWHGIISFVALIIGIFSDTVHVYEVDNTGGWYDFGFLLGATAIWGGSHAYDRTRRRRKRDAEWEEIGRKVEAKLKRKIRTWAEAEPDDEWDVVEAQAEAKLKRKVREWAEEPD